MENLVQYTTVQRLRKLIADLEMTKDEFESQDLNSSSWMTRAELLSPQSRKTIEEISSNSWGAGSLLTPRQIINKLN